MNYHSSICTCGDHSIIMTNAKIKQIDPTRMVTLRNAFVGQMSKRFNHIAILVKKAVADQDCFGLKPIPEVTVFQNLPGVRAFAFGTSQQKVQEFMTWLQEQVNKGLLSVSEYEQLGVAVRKEWTDLYIEDSYKRGVIRARYELIKVGYSIPSIETAGGIALVMANSPFHMDRVGLLYTRTYNELKGVTDSMAQQLSRVLAQGMADGDGPRLIASKLVTTITGQGDTLAITDSLGRFIPAKRRAELIARTEMQRAHHVATIQEYRNWGVIGVNVNAEWSTAGDSRVCEACAELEGKIFTLDEIEPMIPLHPQCFIDPQIPIYTSEGWRPIGKIKIGDLVLTHKKRFRKVYALPRSEGLPGTSIVTFKFKGACKLSMTSEHLILTSEKDSSFYKWKEAGKCKEKESVMFLSNECDNHTGKFNITEWPIESITTWKTRRKKTLYNLSVEEDESYIAKGVVVHNCRCIALPTMPEGYRPGKSRLD